MDELGEVLIKFLVLSVIFEVALNPIFSWEFYLKHIDDKYWRIPITIVTSFVVFLEYDLDIVTDVLGTYGKTTDIGWGGKLLTALLIAGGSDGILHIFEKLNIRTDREVREARSNRVFLEGRLQRLNNSMDRLKIKKQKLLDEGLKVSDPKIKKIVDKISDLDKQIDELKK